MIKECCLAVGIGLTAFSVAAIPSQSEMAKVQGVAQSVPYILNVSPDGSSPLAEAQSRIQALREDGTISRNTPVEIVLEPGVYVLSSPLALTASDSGSPNSPVIWCAKQRGTVSIRGGRTLPWSSFTAAMDTAVVSRLQEQARAHVLVADISTDAPAGGFPEWPTEKFTVPPMPILSLNGRLEEVARWPDAAGIDQGWATFKQFTTQGSGASDFASFTTLEDRAAGWDFSKGVWLFGYWNSDWDDSFVKAKSWSAETKLMSLAAKLKYGIKLNTRAGFVRYFAANLPEELDAPGEYWVDRTTNMLYYYPSSDAPNGELVLSTLDAELVHVGDRAHDIVFRNLTFASAAKGIVSGTDVRRIRLETCDFRALSMDAVTINGQDNVVVGCAFRQLGQGCVVLDGGDRATLRPARNSVEYCDMREYARFQRCYKSAVTAEGCGQAVRGCTICDAPHMAIYYTGNEHQFAWNTVSNVLDETSDAGAIYTGRNSTYLGTRIVGNHFLDFARTNVCAVYFDDCQWGGTVIGNSFTNMYRVLLLGGGKLHDIIGNVISDCSYGFSVDRRGITWGESHYEPNWALSFFKSNLPSNNPLWAAAYPRVMPALAVEQMEPYDNTFADNLLSDCSIMYTTLDTTSGAPTTGMTISGNVTVSTDGSMQGTGIEGFTHYANCSAETSMVSGLAELQARVAAFAEPRTAVVTSPDGNVVARFGVDVTGRLYCSARIHGETLIEPSSVGVTVDGIDYGNLVLPGEPVVAIEESGKAVDAASGDGYVEVSIPLERLVDGDRSATLEVRVFGNGLAWRMRIAGSGEREIAGSVAHWNAADGIVGAAEPYRTTGEVVTPWSTSVLRAAAVVDRVLTVDVATSAVRSLTVAEREALNDGEVTNVVKTGGGTLRLDDELPGYVGSWSLREGTISANMAYDVFGPEGDAPVVVENSSATNSLAIDGSGSMRRPLIVVGNNIKNQLCVGENVSVRFMRSVTVTGASRPYFLAGSTSTFVGGVTTSGGSFVLGGTGNLIFDGVPSSISDMWAQHSLHILFACPSNVVKGLTCYSSTDGTITLGCRDAIVNCTKLNSLANYRFDLSGHDLSVGNFKSTKAGTLTSAEPAVFKFSQTQAATNLETAITGATSLEKAGKAEYAIGCPITSSGVLTIEAGLFRFLPGGSWTTASRITVLGNGTLAVEDTGALGERSVLEVRDGGQLRITDGLVVPVHKFISGGISQKPGKTYGGVNSAADVKLSLFGAGTGVIRVRERGTILSVY